MKKVMIILAVLFVLILVASISPSANCSDISSDGSQVCHRADTNTNGCIDDNELNTFVNRWFISSVDVPMRDLISAIRVQKSGC